MALDWGIEISFRNEGETVLWFADAAFTQPFDFTKTVESTEDITIYAAVLKAGQSIEDLKKDPAAAAILEKVSVTSKGNTVTISGKFSAMEVQSAIAQIMMMVSKLNAPARQATAPAAPAAPAAPVAK